MKNLVAKDKISERILFWKIIFKKMDFQRFIKTKSEALAEMFP